MKRLLLLVLWALLLPGVAFAQGAGTPATSAPPPGLEPPVALTATTIQEPADAPPHAEPVVVRVKLLVGVDGLVKKVELLTHSLAVFDDAVVAAVQQFRFTPARYAGKPVQVEITFTHTFLPPPPKAAPPPQGGPPLVSTLRGKLVEKGTRVPVSGATVAVQVGDRHYTVEADGRGRFRLPLPAGDARVTVHVSAYRPFLQTEHLGSGQELAVAYYIERERYDPYEIMVFGETRREELSRITLRGPELTQVPGTFGDPFRVIQTLPGVASIMSLLPFPVVRGASPGSTGYLVDGTRVPLLYHLLAGPSVIHPEFIDEVQFYPGGAPVLYGGYTAGIIDGRTRRGRPDEHLIDLDSNLLQAGGLVRQPVPYIGATATAAARVGYPGVILSLATDQASLSYWDYQFRLDGGNARNGWTLFTFGARDEVDAPAAGTDPTVVNPPLVPTLILGFHRLDLRAYHGRGALDATYRVVTGIDDTTSSGTDVSTFILEPSARWRYRAGPTLDLVGGVEGSWHSISTTSAIAPAGSSSIDTSNVLFGNGSQYVASALAEALWRPTPRWLVRPGVRGDVFWDPTATQPAVDPRLAVRYRLSDAGLPGDPSAVSDDQAFWVKAGVGIYHQPPRFFLPLPGLDTLPLKNGLLRAVQTSLGVEMPVAQGIHFNVEGFYNDMDPVVFDLAVNRETLAKEAQTQLFKSDTSNSAANAQTLLDRFVAPQIGRAFGVETLLRRQSRTGLYGWISYTLSLSERQRLGEWVAYDYDRTHLLNLVAGLPLPRNWDLGARLQYQSGKPATTTYGYNTARSDGYFRVDVRIDKRAVWNKWLFDFYVDLTNVALFPEEITPGSTIRYVLPTFGVRARL